MDARTLTLATGGIAFILSLLGTADRFFFDRGGIKEKAADSLLFLFFALFSLFDLLFYGFLRSSAANAARLIPLFRSLALAAGIFFIAALQLTFLRRAGLEKKRLRTGEIAIGLFSALVTLFPILNAFTGFLFSTEGNAYLRGDLFYLIYIAEGALWIFSAAMIFRGDETTKKQIIPTYWTCLCLFVLGVVIQILFKKFPAFEIAGLLGIFMIYAVDRAKAQKRFLKEKEEMDKLRKDVSLTNAKLLRSQISPHFIYNALTAIQAMPNNPSATKKAIGDFAGYLRQTLTSINESEQIPFAKELENVKAYFRLEKIRFGNELNIVYEIETTDFDIPALCVQILAENAVKHGVSVKRGGGTIRIATAKKEDSVIISVTDDGVGFDAEKTQDPTHLGINNVKNRIRSLAGGEVTIESEIGRGTKATIRIPR